MSLAFEPTEAQKAAGNYPKHHISVHGLPITIENRKGSKRTGVDKNGKPWSVTMPADYGYFKRSEGADGDHVDCYLGMAHKSRYVLVIDQKDADTGKFDEHKCMLGFTSKKQALDFYKRGFSDGKGEQRVGATTEMDIEEFKNWLKNGDTTERLARKDGGVVYLAEGGAADSPSLDEIFSAPPSKSLDDIFGTPTEDVGYSNAIATSAAKGMTMNWADELQGLKAASGFPDAASAMAAGIPVDAIVGLGRLGYEKLAGRGEATERFEKKKAEVLAGEKAAAEQYPKTALASEIAGAIAMPLPFAGIGKGASLAQMAGKGAQVGALSGALSGLGEGEGVSDRAAKGITSGMVGAGAGALIAPAIGKAAQGIGNLLGRGAREVAEEVPEQAAQADDAVSKITAALREAKPLRGQQETIYHNIRSQQAGTLARIGEQVPGEAGFKTKLASLRGELPKVEFESIRGALTQDNITDLFARIERQQDFQPFDKLHAGEALSKLIGAEGGAVPTNSELALLSKVFPEDFIQAALANKPMLRKFMEHSGEVLNIPRAIMASGDLSAALRQGLPMATTHPVRFGQAFASQHKYALSERAYEGLYKDIERMQSRVTGEPLYDVMRKSGLAIQHIDAPDLIGREERFLTNIPDNVPLFGKIYRGSNRAYTGFLTKLRTDVFRDSWERLESLGGATPRAAADLAEYINTFTGRGEFSLQKGASAKDRIMANKTALEKAAPVMNALLFSPRLLASRVQMLNPQFYYKLDPAIRKEALKSLVGTTGAVTSLLGLAKLAGADVETDPRNSDFAKIKVGNTRYEITGGIAPYLRLAAQLYYGQIVSSTSGRTMTVNEGFKPMTRWDIGMRFLESKEAPTFSFIHKWMKQQGFIGKDYNPQSEAIKSFTPLLINDLWDVYKEYGANGLPMAVPGIYGVGSQTYGKVQFEEGKDKIGLPAARITSPQDWGEYAAEHASRSWKAAFGEGKTPIGSTRNFDMVTFYRDNYSKMDRKEQQRFDVKLARDYPSLDKNWRKTLRDERDLKVTPQEWDLRVKPIPERIMAIKKELDALPTYEEKKRLWGRYATKGMGIITDDVYKKMNKLGFVPKVDPTNTIPEKDQKEIDKALESVVRRQSGGRIKVGAGEYTPEEIEASRREDLKFREFLGRIAPRGIPWQSWRHSRNIENRSNEGNISSDERMRRRYPPYEASPPVSSLSREAGYDDIGKKRGGKIKRRVPPNVTVPESQATLRKQQQALISGRRAAMLFPHKSSELPLPRGMRRMRTKDGLVHFDKRKLTPSQIRKASGEGRINEILEMGPVTKEEALARASMGERPVTVAERAPDGTEMKAALGTEQTAPAQLAALQTAAEPGDWVGVEPVQETLMRRAVA